LPFLCKLCTSFCEAVVGDDITLPYCRVTRSGLEPRFVYVWRDGVELESKKHPSYRERTSVSISGLGHGDISLKLSRVKLSDEGKYICHVPNLPQSFAELFVGECLLCFVSVPVISGININSRAVVLECESKGWYPEPEVLWLDGEGNLLSAGPTETVRGPDDLYTVSSRVTVEKRHSNSFTCRVQQNKTNHTREAHIDISVKGTASLQSSHSSHECIKKKLDAVLQDGFPFIQMKVSHHMHLLNG
uniref:Ig-like domain-containing protein n=1 Tax=Lates calcarifer TaxID=8187 RepID=A0A4W6EFN2_LATCA